MARIKSKEELEGMRHAGKLAAQAVQLAGEMIKPGVSTQEINDVCHDFIATRGGRPASLGYMGFPRSLCTSINDVICHGIPSEKDVLKEGDIINVDIALELNGTYGDTSKMFGVGEVPEDRQRVMDVAHEALVKGIMMLKHNVKVCEIGRVIQEYTESQGCASVRRFCGHGVGKAMHEDFQVPHYYEPTMKTKLRRGVTFTIEPMVNFSRNFDAKILGDGWTAKTVDGAPSAQWEHTIHITGDGIELMTALEGDCVLARLKELGFNAFRPNV